MKRKKDTTKVAVVIYRDESGNIVMVTVGKRKDKK